MRLERNVRKNWNIDEYIIIDEQMVQYGIKASMKEVDNSFLLNQFDGI